MFGPQSCQELHCEAVDYLERDPRSEARLPEQQPPSVLVIDVTSDAADLELLKTLLEQVCPMRCCCRHTNPAITSVLNWSSVLQFMACFHPKPSHIQAGPVLLHVAI